MALALTITLDRDLPEAYAAYTKKPSGKALARESDRLDFAATRRRVTPITSMLSESQKLLIAQMIEEGFDPMKMRLPPELWFTADEGIKTVRALVEHVTANLNDFKQPNPILRDLKAADALLTAADAAQIKFHFSRIDL